MGRGRVVVVGGDGGRDTGEMVVWVDGRVIDGMVRRLCACLQLHASFDHGREKEDHMTVSRFA